MTSSRSDAWGSDELEVLYDFVNDEDWLDEACALLPRRTRNAIQVKMCALRREAEIVPTGTGASATSARRARRRAATVGSRKLALALQALDEANAPALSEHDRRETDTLRLAQLEELDCVIRPGSELQLEFFDGPLFDWREAA